MNSRRHQASAATGWPLYIAIGLIVAIFLLGGGARSDIVSLVVLRPIVAVTLVALIVLLGRRVLTDVPGPFLLLCLTMLLVAFHLVPLPPAIWTQLPGRSEVADMMSTVGVSLGWMPITLSPIDGWNQLFALMVPLAVLYAIVGLGRSGAPVILRLLLVLISVSAVLGLLQAIGPAQGPLYFYRITNNGLGVGLFANRNHQAIFLACAFPVIALYASTLRGSAESMRGKSAMALCGALALVPLLLVTGSRAGFVLAAIGMVGGGLLFRRSTAQYRDRRKSSMRLILPAMGLGGLGLVGLLAATAGRNTAWDRIIADDAVEDLRFQALPQIIEAAWAYFPFGSGAGSFVPAYKLVEREQLITGAYFNHAHNDLAEVVLEFGLPGLLLILVAVLGWAWSVQRLWRLNQAAGTEMPAVERFGWAGAAVLLILGLGSIFDYPLRTPSLAALGTIAAIWLAWAAGPDRGAGVDEPRGNVGKGGSNRLRASGQVEN